MIKCIQCQSAFSPRTKEKICSNECRKNRNRDTARRFYHANREKCLQKENDRYRNNPEVRKRKSKYDKEKRIKNKQKYILYDRKKEIIYFMVGIGKRHLKEITIDVKYVIVKMI